ncbi:MAG: response regulator transcription factor [Anaerolineae bacterium]|nr:response regulator transcription factor [Anaerolineae bacterium]
MRILIIEDDQKLAGLIAHVLRKQHYVVDMAHNGEDGLTIALDGKCDIAIVDWMLPKRDGPSICRAIRAAKLPVAMLLLTARGQVEDRVIGLDSGADDYLTKPFAFEELSARVRALSRRFFAANHADDNELRCGDLVLDVISHQARVANRPLDLTVTEWNLLEFLLRHRGQVLSRQQILDHVWSYEQDVQPTMVDLYVSYVRRKLGDDAAPMLATVRGVGYRLEPPRN